MSVSFPPQAHAIRIAVTVFGPRRSHTLTCTLDTGSPISVLPATVLRMLGFDLNSAVGYTRLRSATGIVRVPLLRLCVVSALDRVQRDVLVAAHDFPLGVISDGLLGLDFFREQILKLDFVSGRASLCGKRWWQFWR